MQVLGSYRRCRKAAEAVAGRSAIGMDVRIRDVEETSEKGYNLSQGGALSMSTAHLDGHLSTGVLSPADL